MPTTILPGGARSKVWYLLETGDCLRDLPPSTGIEELIVVSCDTAHAAQVFAVDYVGTLPDFVRPIESGESTTTTRAGPGGGCFDAFEAAVGVPAEQSPYDISYLAVIDEVATAAPQDLFTKDMVICLLSQPDGAPLTQSVVVE